MNRQDIIKLTQSYIGMRPQDIDCVNWNDMQQKFADELLKLEAKDWKEIDEIGPPPQGSKLMIAHKFGVSEGAYFNDMYVKTDLKTVFPEVTHYKFLDKHPITGK